MEMIRTGNSLEFRTPVGNLTGYINIADLGILASTGSKVPVLTRDNILKGFAYCDGNNQLVLKCAERKFAVAWTELMTCARTIGYTCFITRVDSDPEQKAVVKPDADFSAVNKAVDKSGLLSAPGSVTLPVDKKAPVLETEQNTPTVNAASIAKCSEKNEYHQIPPKKIKSRSTAKPSFTRQNHRKVPTGGIS